MAELEDDFDDNEPAAVPTDVNGVPILPRSIQKKLFVSHQGYDHLLYPGGDLYQQLDRTIGSDLIAVRNPTANVARISIFVGLNADFQVRAERVLVPARFRPSERLMLDLLGRRMMPLRLGWMRVLLTLEPGESAQVPDHWLAGLRRLNEGVVEGGLFPHIEVVGEVDPPVKHAAFRSSEPARHMAAARRLEPATPVTEPSTPERAKPAKPVPSTRRP